MYLLGQGPRGTWLLMALSPCLYVEYVHADVQYIVLRTGEVRVGMIVKENENYTQKRQITIEGWSKLAGKRYKVLFAHFK